MIIKSGTVAFWRDLFPGHDKFVFLLGTFTQPTLGIECVAFFTISSQTKWAKVPAKRREMQEIPKGTADYLPYVSFIQCWDELGFVTLMEFRELERSGHIMFRGELPQYVDSIRKIVHNSDALSAYDIENALFALASEPPRD